MTTSDAAPRTEDRTPCEERNCLLATALLVDSRGWLLLQERDEHAPIAPNQWGLVGGHRETGETWAEALQRELEEETGLHLADGLELWYDEVVQHSPKVSMHLADHLRIWVAKVDLTDDDITVGRGAGSSSSTRPGSRTAPWTWRPPAGTCCLSSWGQRPTARCCHGKPAPARWRNVEGLEPSRFPTREQR